MNSRTIRAYLPSRKLRYIIGGLVILFVISLFILVFDGSESVSSNISTNSNQEDADNDGLALWRENLWGTDPENPDTDADGTEDGAEINQNRDPLEPAPADTLAPTSSSTEYQSSTTNVTQLAENNLPPRALVLAAAQQNGENISSQDLRRVAQSLDTSFSTTTQQYSLQDLNVQSNSDSAARSYLQNIIQILQTDPNTPLTNPLLVVSDYLQGNGGNLSTLNENITHNEMIVENLIEIAVPSTYAQLHLELINSFQTGITGIKQIRSAEDDPLQAVIGVERYRTFLGDSDQAAIDLAEQINNDLN